MTDQDKQQIESTQDAANGFEDEHGISLASKVLSGVALIAVGGILALWLGPKIAPNLPVGMAPVAAWLSPGSTVGEAAVAELRAEMNARINAISTVSTKDVEGVVAYSTDALRIEMNGRIDGLSDQLSATDNGDIEARLAVLETKTNGLRAELSSLMTQLTEVSTAGGEVSSETTAQIAIYAAAMDGLKAEIEALAAQNGALSQKIDGVEAVANRQVAEAETIVNEVTATAAVERNAAALRTSLNDIEAALAAGQPFGPDLAAYMAAGGGEIPQVLEDTSGGVVTMARLRADFPEAAHAAIRASIVTSADDGLLSGASAFLRAQVATRSLTPQTGLAPDAVLSRAEAALKQDDLNAALKEIELLPETSTNSEEAALMGAWIDVAQERLRAMQAFEALVANMEAAQ